MEDSDSQDTETNRVVYVDAHFCEEWAERTVLEKSDERIPLFGKISLPKFRFVKKEIQLQTSDCEIDGQRLAEDVRAATLALNEQGYRIVSITPVTSGQFSPRYERNKRSRSLIRNSMKQIGFGYSYTEGMVIVAEVYPTEE